MTNEYLNSMLLLLNCSERYLATPPPPPKFGGGNLASPASYAYGLPGLATKRKIRFHKIGQKWHKFD